MATIIHNHDIRIVLKDNKDTIKCYLLAKRLISNSLVIRSDHKDIRQHLNEEFDIVCLSTDKNHIIIFSGCNLVHDFLGETDNEYLCVYKHETNHISIDYLQPIYDLDT